MAKAKTIEGFSTEKQGPGWKRCREENGGCGGYVKGPQKQECPGCGHKFVVLVKKPKPKPPVVPQPSGGKISEIHERNAMLTALRMGGVEQAKSAIEQLSNSPALEIVVLCGSAERALQLLEDIEQETK